MLLCGDYPQGALVDDAQELRAQIDQLLDRNDQRKAESERLAHMALELRATVEKEKMEPGRG